jgi:hypothetical protein
VGVAGGLEGAADVGVNGVVPVGYGITVAQMVDYLGVVPVDVLQQFFGAALKAAAGFQGGADVVGGEGFLVVGTGDVLPVNVLQVIGARRSG